MASDEPKAVETLQELASRPDVPVDPGFREVRRPQMWSTDSDYRATARAYVEGVCHDGWEPHDEVFNRFEAAVAHHAVRAAEQARALVIGTHGLAPTVWLSRHVHLAPSPAWFWAQLRFPDLIKVDLAAH